MMIRALHFVLIAAIGMVAAGNLQAQGTDGPCGTLLRLEQMSRLRQALARDTNEPAGETATAAFEEGLVRTSRSLGQGMVLEGPLDPYETALQAYVLKLNIFGEMATAPGAGTRLQALAEDLAVDERLVASLVAELKCSPRRIETGHQIDGEFGSIQIVDPTVVSETRRGEEPVSAALPGADRRAGASSGPGAPSTADSDGQVALEAAGLAWLLVAASFAVPAAVSVLQPSDPAKTKTHPTQERRDKERHNCNIDALAHFEDDMCPVRILNIGKKGCKFGPPPAESTRGDTVIVAIGDTSCPGTLRWVGRTTAGLEFDEALSDDDFARLATSGNYNDAKSGPSSEASAETA